MTRVEKISFDRLPLDIASEMRPRNGLMRHAVAELRKPRQNEGLVRAGLVGSEPAYLRESGGFQRGR